MVVKQPADLPLFRFDSSLSLLKAYQIKTRLRRRLPLQVVKMV